MNRLAVMETFVRIVEMGSFSAAARHMNVGQSAVSKSVAHLEQRLGVRLLMRSTHGLRPTEAGQTYFEGARRAIQEADEAEHAARGVDAGLEGRLRISAGTSFGKLHLLPHLPAFLAAHPKLSVELVLEDRTTDLIGEGIDIAIRIGPLNDCSLVGRKIAASRRLVLGTPAYFDCTGVPETPADLMKHEAVIYTRDHGGSDTWVFRKGETQTSVTLPGRLRVSAAEVVRGAVLHGMGLAVVSPWMFEPELASGAIRAVLTDWTLSEADLWVLFPTGRLVSTKARAFVAFVETALRRLVPDGNNQYEVDPSTAICAAE